MMWKTDRKDMRWKAECCEPWCWRYPHYWAEHRRELPKQCPYCQSWLGVMRVPVPHSVEAPR